MKRVSTTWDETRFIDGYPGKYAVWRVATVASGMWRL